MGGCTSQTETIQAQSHRQHRPELLNWCPVSPPFHKLYELLEQNLIFSSFFSAQNFKTAVIALLDEMQEKTAKGQTFSYMYVRDLNM